MPEDEKRRRDEPLALVSRTATARSGPGMRAPDRAIRKDETNMAAGVAKFIHLITQRFRFFPNPRRSGVRPSASAGKRRSGGNVITGRSPRWTSSSRWGKIVLVRRRHPPPGWAIPGGFIDPGNGGGRRCPGSAGGDGTSVTLTALLGVYSDPRGTPPPHDLRRVHRHGKGRSGRGRCRRGAAVRGAGPARPPRIRPRDHPGRLFPLPEDGKPPPIGVRRHRGPTLAGGPVRKEGRPARSSGESLDGLLDPVDPLLDVLHRRRVRQTLAVVGPERDPGTDATWWSSRR